jgi:Condensation domain
MHQATSLTGAADSAEFDPFAGPAIEVVLTTTEPQREIWLADQLSRDASLGFNEVLRIDFAGPLDVAALSRAVDTVVARHESLRATLSSDGMDMLVAEASSGTMEVTDAAGDERVVTDACALAVETPFDLLAGPLFKARLVTIDASRHTLLLAAHRVVCDG